MTKRVTPHMRVLELSKKQSIEDIVIEAVRSEYGELVKSSARLGLSSGSILTRWIDQLGLQAEVYRIRQSFGLSVPQNWSSEDISNTTLRVETGSIEDECLDVGCGLTFSLLVRPYLTGIWITENSEHIIEVLEQERHRFKLNISALLAETDDMDLYTKQEAI